MAIKVVNSRYPGFIFDGENSRDYGVYITDVEVFGAPKRKVQMISIPGRNGNYALDEGSFENIPVKYKCVLGAGTEEDFNNGISDFRNWLASKVGYKILSDEINLGEYRKGVFLEGMEVPTLNKKTGTFEIVFDCMPQRWLDDASALPVEMASGDDIFNPTLFDASPLLSVWGYGDINLNDKTISVNDVPIGRVILANAEQTDGGRTYYTGNRYTFTIDPSALDTGDDIYGMYMDGSHLIGRGLTYTIYALTAVGYEPLTGTVTRISEHAFDFEYGTADTFTIVNNNLQYEILRISDAQTITGVLKYRIEVAYDGDRTITVTPYYTGTTFTEGIQPQGILFGLGHDTVYGDSTVSSLGTPLLIDLDIGEAYKEENGEIISSNTGVSLPAKLPTLKPGHNTITFDNTVDKLVITPRWWKV